MTSFPALPDGQWQPTRDALHAYSRVLGDWLKNCRARRKHWWHASLRPSLTGLTTGVVRGALDFELELNLAESQLQGRTANGAALSEPLRGQSATELASVVAGFLNSSGVTADPPAPPSEEGAFAYSADTARTMHTVMRVVTATMARLRAGIREETSPIQLWPHHFDLSMLWLPGEQIPGQDPDDEESADKQLNFGFTFGDAGIAEPYLYVTAYPATDALGRLSLSAGAHWHSDGFTGAVLPYQTLRAQADPQAQLLDLWWQLLSAARQHMLKPNS